MWVVVLFTSENSISVVPKCWLMNENQLCSWPPVPDVTNYVKKCIKPEGNWNIFSIRLLGNGKIYDNYLKARSASKLAEETSDINSDRECQKRRRKINKIYSDPELSSSESEESNHENANRSSAYPSLPTPSFSPNFKPACNTEEGQLSHSIRTSTPRIGNKGLNVDSSACPSSSSSFVCSNKPASTIAEGQLLSSSMESSIARVSNRSVNVEDNPLKKLLHQQSMIHFKLSNIQADITTIVEFLKKNDVVRSVTGDDDFIYEGLPLKDPVALERFDEQYLKVDENLKKFVSTTSLPNWKMH